MSGLRRVAVFCGACSGVRASYKEMARATGMALADAGLGLVYGGSSLGLMGILADAHLEAGGEVIGVAPHGLADRERIHSGLTKLHLVDTMHTRKAMMAELADAFVALPGGLGTLDELFEILTWSQLGLHSKPIMLLNVEGYWDDLLRLVRSMGREGFADPQLLEHRLHVVKSVDALLEHLDTSAVPILVQRAHG